MNTTCAIIHPLNVTTVARETLRQMPDLLTAISIPGAYRWVVELLEFWVKVKAYQSLNQGLDVGISQWLRGILQRKDIRVKVSSTDAIYAWITAWMTRSPEWRNQTNFELSSDKSGRGPPNLIAYRFDGRVLPDDKARDSEANYNPSCGVEYVFRFRHFRVTIKREEVGKGAPGDKTAYYIRIEKGDCHILDEFVAAAKEAYLKQLTGVVCVYQAGLHDGVWTYLKSNEKRNLDTVHLDGNQKELLLEDVEKFLSEGVKKVYKERGIPYRRGYLLYGPPGTGKSTIVTALAGHLDLKVHVLQLSFTAISDPQLNILMAALPQRCIVLLEDIDKTFSKATRTVQGQGETEGVTLGGLLNAMDGLCAVEGRLLFVTTNNKDVLDEAVIRPGRLHVHMEIGYATKDMARKYFSKYFSAGTSATAEEVEMLSEQFSMQLQDGFSMAKLEEYLLTHDSSPQEAAAQFAEWQGEQIRNRNMFHQAEST